MFSKIMKIMLISLFSANAAFANGWGHHHHFYGYGPYYGGGYVAPGVGYYPAPQPYYAPPLVATPYAGIGMAPFISIPLPIFGGGWGHGGHHR